MALLLGAVVTNVNADYFEDVGYAVLEAELGATPPNGTGVAVTLVEACLDEACTTWAPSPGSRSITVGDSSTPVSSPYSNHATNVGKRFYASLSTTQGIGVSPGPSISAYPAIFWVQSDFLRLGQTQKPKTSSSRIANHSWVGDFKPQDDPTNDAFNLDILRRIDWLVDSDDFLQVVAYSNGNNPLLASAYNIISVNRVLKAGVLGSHSVAGDSAYASVRAKPDVVAPETNTSNATPRVASAAALLINTSQLDPSLSSDATTNSRTGVLVRNAERSEVIKATLMAGAERATKNSYPTSAILNIVDYRADPANRTDNGLDLRFGSGQLNIYNSYRIITAGEQDSVEDGGSGDIDAFGFDYDPSFGGSGPTNDEGTYFFSTGIAATEFLATLAWNIEIDPGRFNNFATNAVLRNLDLFLYDVSDGGNWVLVEQSTSAIDNTETIRAWLNAETNYALQVRPAGGQSSFSWDYGLAWRTRIPGDVTGDGNINAADLLILERAVMDQTSLDQQQRARADVHPVGGDGTLNVSDVLALQKILTAP